MDLARAPPKRSGGRDHVGFQRSLQEDQNPGKCPPRADVWRSPEFASVFLVAALAAELITAERFIESGKATPAEDLIMA